MMRCFWLTHLTLVAISVLLLSIPLGLVRGVILTLIWLLDYWATFKNAWRVTWNNTKGSRC